MSDGTSMTRWVVIAASVIAIAFAGCGGSSSTSGSAVSDSTSAGSSQSAGSIKPAGGGTVKVGNITSVAGIGGTFAGFQAGVKAFFQYYNANGGINGTKVDLTAIDDAGDPGKNAAAARTLASQDHAVAIVGEASLADAASQRYLQAQGIPVVGGWAASSAWQRPATNMFLSLAGPNKPYCGLWSLDMAKAQGARSVAFIDQDFPEAIETPNVAWRRRGTRG